MNLRSHNGRFGRYDMTATRHVIRAHSQAADDFLAAEFALITGDLTADDMADIAIRAERAGFMVRR